MTAIIDHKADLAAYIADNYGECKKGIGCVCLKRGWMGTSCPDWVPVKAKTWKELREVLANPTPRVLSSPYGQV